MTSAASYVTRALLVLGAIMNSLIALKYIAGSKASTVESLGPIGKLFTFYMDPKLYLEGATKKASGLQTIIGLVCLISAIATLSQPPPPPTHTAGA